MDKYLILYITIFIAILTYYSAITETGSLLDKMTEKFRGTVVFYIAVGVFITYHLFDENLKEISRNNTLKIIESAWLDLMKEINLTYDKCPHFCSTLFFDWQHRNLPPMQLSKSKKDNWMSVLYLSTLIFQSWENVLTIRNVDNTEFNSWMSFFLAFARSDDLYKVWNISKIHYNHTTVEFGDILFSEIRKSPPKNMSELLILCKKIDELPSVKNIFIILENKQKS